MTARRAPRTFADLFEDAVARYPDETAIVAADRTLTYAQLARQSRRVARRLIAMGGGPEDVMAVVTDRGTSGWLTGVLGVLLAGGAYLALDPAYPPERIRFILDDASPRLILYPEPPDWDAGVPGVVIEPILSEEIGDSVIEATERVSVLDVDNLAYVVYTSGSTGRPKGVAVTHRGMAALTATQHRAVRTGQSDRVLQWASPTFDAAFWDVTLALLHGATLHLAPPEELLPGEPLAETLRGRGITHATLPPVALAALDPGGGVLAGCTVVSTGDTCTQGIVDTWAAPGRRLINGYGPTETTVGATLSGPLTAGTPADIGTAFDGASVDVVDAELECVEPGMVGELVVGGYGVARGYLGRPWLTAERFRPDPRGAAGARVYLTGDLGCRRPDGRLEFVGRLDDQVKLRGFRIELGEIEVALAQHPDVLAAVVAVRQLRARDDSIVAWVTTASGVTDPTPIREYLAGRLPRFMVPAAIVILDAMPTNAHGKIDRGALPLPSGGVGRLGESQEVEDELQRCVLAVFAQSLEAPNLGPEENFFDLGGDSIGYTRVISRLNHELGVRLPLREAFIHASPRGIALLVASTRT